MLKATKVYKPAQQDWTIVVTVEGVTLETNRDIAAAAMAAAHEQPHRLFGWEVRRYEDTPGIVTVNLHRS